MKLERILPFARTLLEKAVIPGSLAVDATVGNGHDTVLLAGLVGATGTVYGFDVQQEAIDNTKKRLEEQHIQGRVQLFHQSHADVTEVIPKEQHGKITGAIFNLGYLPGGNKEIVTKPDSTIKAIQGLISIMAPEAILVLVIYHGHPEGAVERDDLLDFVETLDQKLVHVLRYQFMNQQNNPPFIIAIEKR